MNHAGQGLTVHGLFKDPVDFFHIFDQMPNCVLVLDRDRRVVAVNSAFENLTGFTRKEACGVPVPRLHEVPSAITDAPLCPRLVPRMKSVVPETLFPRIAEKFQSASMSPHLSALTENIWAFLKLLRICVSI